MNLVEQLEQMILLATIKHFGQIDKSGLPYILHPLAVMNSVNTIEEKIVAVGHDLVEDTNVTLNFLRVHGFSEEIVDGIDSITHRKDEAYVDYINRVKRNSISKVVKRSDIANNLREDRLEKLSKVTVNRLRKKYSEALSFLWDK